MIDYRALHDGYVAIPAEQLQRIAFGPLLTLDEVAEIERMAAEATAYRQARERAAERRRHVIDLDDYRRRHRPDQQQHPTPGVAR